MRHVVGLIVVLVAAGCGERATPADPGVVVAPAGLVTAALVGDVAFIGGVGVAYVPHGDSLLRLDPASPQYRSAVWLANARELGLVEWDAQSRFVLRTFDSTGLERRRVALDSISGAFGGMQFWLDGLTGIAAPRGSDVIAWGGRYAGALPFPGSLFIYSSAGAARVVPGAELPCIAPDGSANGLLVTSTAPADAFSSAPYVLRELDAGSGQFGRRLMLDSNQNGCSKPVSTSDGIYVQAGREIVRVRRADFTEEWRVTTGSGFLLAASPDGSLLFAVQAVPDPLYPGRAYVYSRSGAVVTSFWIGPVALAAARGADFLSRVSAVAWSADGRALLLASQWSNRVSFGQFPFGFGRIVKLDATTGAEVARGRLADNAAIVDLVPLR